MMKCWKCQKELEDSPGNTLAFRAICDHCAAWLHCCVNCCNYKPGLPNDCKIPGTEPVADRESSNFCEEFLLLKNTQPDSSTSLRDLSKNLFGEALDPSKKKFNNLFHD